MIRAKALKKKEGILNLPSIKKARQTDQISEGKEIGIPNQVTTPEKEIPNQVTVPEKEIQNQVSVREKEILNPNSEMLATGLINQSFHPKKESKVPILGEEVKEILNLIVQPKEEIPDLHLKRKAAGILNLDFPKEMREIKSLHSGKVVTGISNHASIGERTGQISEKKESGKLNFQGKKGKEQKAVQTESQKKSAIQAAWASSHQLNTSNSGKIILHLATGKHLIMN